MKPFKEFSVSEWLIHLEKQHKQEIQLGLQRVKAVGEILNLIKPAAFVFIVAGTNGKGSIVAALESIYRSAKYRVATYSSPHLISFNERIKINQKSISDEALRQAFLEIEMSRGDVPLTYFETATLAALSYFKKQSVDVIILEVGMGGRLDATNIIDADLALISTIDLDHQAFLGATRELIANEKAGILRQGQACIFAEYNPPQSLITYSQRLNCRSYQLGKDYNFQVDETGLSLSLKDENKIHKINLPKFPLNLHLYSITAAITAALVMKKKLLISSHQIKEGIETINLSGRLQLIPASVYCKVPVILDVAHNPQSSNYLSSYLKNYCLNNQVKGQVHVIFSALKDKDIQGIIAPLVNLVDIWYPAELGGERAASKAQLASVLGNYGIMKPCFGNPLLAFEEARQNVVKGDLILVYGSFHTVGAILPYLTPREG